MELFDYLMAKKGHNLSTHGDLFSYLLGKKASGGSGTYTTFSGTSLNISNTIKAKIKKFMLNSTELTQDGTPTPDNPVDVHIITGNNNIKINQNLAQIYKDNIISGYALTSDGWVAEAGDYVIYIPCESNTQYEIYKVQSERLRIATTIENPTTRPQIYQFYNSTDTTYASITTNNEAKYLCIFFRRFSDTLTMQEILDTMNVCKTNQEQNYPITLGSLEYCKIGDYADQIFKNTTDSPYYDNILIENEWYLYKKIINYNGSWRLGETQLFNDSLIFYGVITNVVDNEVYSTHFPYYRGIYRQNYEGIDTFPNSNEIGIRVNKSIATTVNELQEWLSNNNVKILYATTTPTYIHISQEDYPTLKGQLDNLYNNAESYDGQTNITQTNDDLPFNISVDVKVTSANLSMSNSLNAPLNLDNTNELEEIEEPNEDYQEL